MGNVTPRPPHPCEHTPGSPGRWETVRQATKSWPGTLRLCLILLVMAVPTVATVAVAIVLKS